jgi:two-component system cell cycle response regulator DivK
MSNNRKRIVMVVEDFEDNRFMMRRLLEMSGYRVVEAVNGEQAVEVAERERPHLILMDLSLPILDGLAATRRIRQNRELRRIPIIAVSAHDTSDFHADALAAGCNDYVTKPIDFEQLETLLSRLLPVEGDDNSRAWKKALPQTLYLSWPNDSRR